MNKNTSYPKILECPRCKNTDLDYTSDEFDKTNIYYRFKCPKCGSKLSTKFELTNIEDETSDITLFDLHNQLTELKTGIDQIKTPNDLWLWNYPSNTQNIDRLLKISTEFIISIYKLKIANREYPDELPREHWTLTDFNLIIELLNMTDAFYSLSRKIAADYIEDDDDDDKDIDTYLDEYRSIGLAIENGMYEIKEISEDKT
ncbi:hypothetical protein [Bacteroides sp.]|uniref:hypothetical protein n=1 Tax=Bacteroides sp. TaxID=29523 RepID=UPI002623665F|nr:hypothetical protein [Bacteroides sp.]MDD3039080.1 hypothetical protein [Bacteroides sp.]